MYALYLWKKKHTEFRALLQEKDECISLHSKCIYETHLAFVFVCVCVCLWVRTCVCARVRKIAKPQTLQGVSIYFLSLIEAKHSL